MKHIHSKFFKKIMTCLLVLFSACSSLSASAATQHYFIRPLRNGDTVFFDNSAAHWSTVKIYIFNSTDRSHPFEWDERPTMDYVTGDIWSYTVTPDKNIQSHGYDYVIFTNEGSEQTIDLGFVGNGYAYKVDAWQDSKRSGYWYLYDDSAVEFKPVRALETGDVVYFDDSGATNWQGVNLYMFSNIGGEPRFAWNGPAMTGIGNQIYEYPVTADLNIEDYKDNHVVFSNTSATAQTIDLGFIDSNYAYKVELWEDGKGSGYWYVYNKSNLQAAINEMQEYLSKLKCLPASAYADATEAVADATLALSNEVPVETEAPGHPGDYWSQVDTEIKNLQDQLAILKAEYQDVPTVCTFSPDISKTITNPQDVFRFGDTVQFKINITNTRSDFSIMVDLEEQLNGVSFIPSTTGDYVVISDQNVQTRWIAAGETISIYASYPVLQDITSSYTNIAAITSAVATDSNYYLSEGSHAANISFDTQSWEDVPVPTGVDTNESIFTAMIFISIVPLVITIAINCKRRFT